MTIKNYSKSSEIPNYQIERDVFGLPKPKNLSMIKRLKHKSINAPELNVTYAGLGIRTLATFIDLVLIACLMLIPEIFFLSFNFNDFDFNSFRIFMFLIIWIFYHSTFDSSDFQATFGKRLLKIRIIDLNGKRISFVRAIFRCLAVSISIVSIGFGIWSISTEPKKQSWHDLMAGTFVIKSEQKK